ncbi:MAG: gliding motility-associated C-terminal domain-containing protein [Flavobacterium sp. JAD_PAG50586_2]|nr:MAG: gliding motility-associated C-terminal domain-containing protein [Flavobacterium sp. JAD_PAG50586_2]
MKNLYFNSIAKKLKCLAVLLIILFGFSNTINAQVRKAFTQRTSQYSPTKTIYNVKGDFTMLGNTCLTPQNYTNGGNNNDASMIYVDTDNDASTFNSSSSTLVIPVENSSTPECSNIVFAGLYWTGKSSANTTFNVTKNSVTKTFNKRIVKLKGPSAGTYTNITAAATDIYYPSGSDDNIYSAYAEITDYVRTNGLGKYTVADMALLEGNPGGTGYSGGWGIIVIYENSKMKWRDVTIFDGYAYVEAGNSSSGIQLPVSGFNSAISGNVGMKIGIMASEGDVGYTGDYFRIRNLATNTYTTLSRAANGVVPNPDNFFNSSINAPGTRTPSLQNNTGIDIGIINIPNTNNSIIGNSQTSTRFLYGTNGDTYSIFTIAMSVDAYVPEAEGIITTTTINNQPAVQPYTITPGQEAGFSIDVRNLGTEAINNYRVVVPLPYNASYVPGSAAGTLFYTTPNPTTITGTFDPTLGATGSIVWNFGTLPLPANPATLLARLTFRLQATTDCEILANATCSGSIAINGNSTGVGSTTNVALNNSNLIQGYTVNGSCAGQAIPAPINIGINGTNYVQQNCPGTDFTRHFSFCSASTSVRPSEIASNFPTGSLFYNSFPVTLNSVQYTEANPIPLVAGSTVTYYAVPTGGGSGCNFPFTISKCPAIIAQNDALAGGNGTTGNPNIGNVLNNNGSGVDTLNNVQALITQVNITVTTPATPINGNPVPVLDPLTGQVSVPPGTPAGTYTIVYNLCEKLNPTTNCDPATVTITVTAPAILAVANNFSIQCSTPGLLGNVITNDLLNSLSFLPGLVNITLVSGGNANISLDLTTGDISTINSGLAVGQYTLVYRICDKLNPTNCSQANIIINVVDTVPPTWTTAAAALNTTVECSDAASLAAAQALFPVAIDACDTNVNNIIKTSGTFVPGTCGATGTYTNTWVVTDDSGNTSVVYTQTITVVDTIAPTWLTVANVLNRSVECNDTAGLTAAQLLAPTAADNCGGAVTYTKTSGAFVAGSCGATGTYTNTWVARDACLNTSTTFTQTITVVDTVAPTWSTAATALNTTVECNDTAGLAVAQALAPTAADNCAGDVTYTKTSGAFVAGSCGATGTYTNTWVARDACLNTSTTFTQTITVVDTVSPTWSTAATALNTTVECSDAAGLAAAQALAPTATDNCAGDVTYTKTSGAFVAGSCGASGSYTNTWIARDACLNTSTTFTQTITVVDTIAPTWSTAAGSLNTTLECSDVAGLAAAQALTPTATDNCAGDVTYTKTSGAFVAGSCGASGSYTNTWIARDACLNTSTVFTQTITVVDAVAPTFTAPANTEVFTTADCTFDASIAITGDVTNEADNCSTGLQATFTDSVADGQCPGSKIITRTWSLVDACGNTAATQTQTITVTDNIAPTFTAPADITINTAADCTYDASVTITGDVTNEADNCSTGLQATFTDSVADGQCPGSKIITRTWSLIDACGNTAATQTQTITVTDNIAPTFTAPADITINTAADCTYDASVTITGDVTNEADNCSTRLQATFTDSVADGTCAGSHIITRTWSLVDACGNVAATQTQTITVTDNIAPTFTAPANTEVFTTADCTYNASVAITGDVTNEADNCSTGLQATFTDSVADGTCAGSHIITRTWSLVDACGNTAAAQTQTITVTDNIAPTFTAPANTEIFTTADCTYNASVAITGDVTNEADNCSTGLQATFTDSVADGTCTGSKIITRTWSLIDACGNTAATQTQTITVTDNIAPTFTAPADITINTAADCTYDASVTITGDVTNEADNCSKGLQATFTDSVADGACQGSHIITRTWSLVDACGNTAATQVQTITVSDNIAPTFTAPTNTEVFTTADCTYDASVTITGDVTDEADNCSTGLQATFTDSVADGACQGSKIITRTWSLVDACGNTAATQTQTITVTDNIAPTFTAPANTEIFTTADCTYNASVAITGDVTNEADNCSTGLQATFTDSVADGACAGSKIITRTWSLLDTCGNAATTQTQTITVTDNIAPTFTAPADITINTAADCTFDSSVGFTGDVTDEADNCSTGLQASYNDSIADGPCVGSKIITRTWSLVDACGNTAATQVQTITVTDNIAPTFTTPANTEVFTTADCTYDATVAITGDVTDEADNCSTGLQATFTDSVADGACQGSKIITRTWSLVDGCGNTAATQTQTITVTDNIAPTFTAPANTEIFTTADCTYNASVAITGDVTNEADNCSTGLQATFTDSVADGACAGSKIITRTWSLLDTCGNAATTQTQTITVTDNIAPTFTAPANTEIFTTADCTYDATVAITGDVNNEADNCSTGLQATFSDSVADGACQGSKIITRTWSLVDACGNAAATQVQTITVSDNIAPIFTTPAGNLIVQCGNGTTDALQVWLASNGGAVASDNCSDVTWSNDFNAISNNCSAAVTVIFTATDACGNFTRSTATFTIEDTTPPTFTAPANTEVFTTADCTYDVSVAITGDVTNEADNCTALQATFTDSVTEGQCQGSKIIIRTWSLVDACGNAAANQTQTITVTDNIVPTFTAPANTEIFTTADCTFDASVAITGDVTNEADNCSTGLQATFTDSVADGTCTGSKIITRTWSLIDACGNTAATQTQTITVTDNIAPTFTAPADITINTAADCTYDASVTITGDVTNEADNCSTGLQATFTDSVADGACQGSKIITRTWSLVDACGNTAATQTQTITVTDNIAPTFTAPANTEVFTTADCTYDASVTITGDVTNEADNCSTGLQATFTDSVADGACQGSKIITRTWSLVDACGNTAATQTQTITVTDNIAPTFTAPANTEIFTTADCTYNASVAITGDVTDEADNCSTGLQATFSDNVADGQCPGSKIITRTWSLVDACGNTAATQTQTITVTDNIAPTFTAPANTEVFTNADCTYDASVAITGDVTNEADNCSTGIQATFTDSVADGACAGSHIITRTWSLVDACGNTAATQTQTITVTDNIAPTFTAPADITINTAADCTYDASVTITGDVTNEADNCSTGLQATFTDSVADGTCTGSKIITRTWSLVDACGNTAATQTQTITVTDNIAPTFTAPADITINTAADCTYDASVTITGDVTNEADNCSTGLQATFTDSVADGTCPGSKIITRTWSLVDACGNTAATQTQTITVTDNIAPTFTAPADITINTAADCTYDASVTITGDVTNEADNCSTGLQATFTDSVADGTCAGSHIITRTWSLVDACGNTAATQTQTITVTDNIAPTFTAPANITINTAADCTYDATVIVTGDVTDEADNCSTGLQATFTDSVADGPCAGSKIITRTWSLVDACGNAAATQTQTITVTDNIAPTFTAPADITINTAADCTFDSSVGFTGDVTDEADNCSTGLQASYNDSIADGSCAGSKIITRTWSLVDACGNAAATQVQTITVSDNTAPLAPIAPASITGVCSAQVPAMISLTAIDNCSGPITVSGVDSTVQGSCPNSFTVTRTWTFVDACGNSSSATQTISVNDNVAPTFDQAAPANTTASCDNVPAPAVLTATDNCGTATVNMTEVTLQGSCPSNYQLVRTWIATDACGNASLPVTQTIDVSDTTGPVIITPIDDISVTCDLIPVAPVLTAADFTDTCSVVGNVVYTETQTQPVGGVFTITRTWSVSNECGVVTIEQQIITVTQSVVQETTINIPASDEEFCNDEVNGTTDLATLLPPGTPTNGTWVNVNNVGTLTGSVFGGYFGLTGAYTFSYSYDTALCPQKINIIANVDDCGIVLPCELIVIHNAFSPNNDPQQLNEYFSIEHIEDFDCYPTNTVEIYNRWGVLVYEAKNYDNNTVKFTGISEGRATVSKSEELPTGTYFYIIQYTTTDGQTVNKDGYLYLTR